jgi:RNA:NAD 2'-phosphotransferase (TPT1/KptA family)
MMLTEKETIKLSKFLSLVLRHQPELIGITLDEQGWVTVADLKKKAAGFGNPFSLEELEYVVERIARSGLLLASINARSGRARVIRLRLIWVTNPRHRLKFYIMVRQRMLWGLF